MAGSRLELFVKGFGMKFRFPRLIMGWELTRDCERPTSRYVPASRVQVSFLWNGSESVRGEFSR